MTRRERLENRLEKRKQWAAARAREADSRFKAAHAAVDMIPFGQPILVGHHSEKRHRAALNRHDTNMRKAVESSGMAEHHQQKASGLEAQLERTIFSDDEDAIEALQVKIAALEEERDGYKRLNAWWKKHGSMVGFPGMSDEEAKRLDVEIPTRYTWERKPVPGYRLTNLGAEIRRAKQRIEDIKERQARSAKAEESGGIVIDGEAYVRITFAEKPDRSVLNALRQAGFRWSGGSWHGPRSGIPKEVESNHVAGNSAGEVGQGAGDEQRSAHTVEAPGETGAGAVSQAGN